jgi:CHASE3 domain sensor protein
VIERNVDLPRLSLRQLIWLCVGSVIAIFLASTILSVTARVAVAHAVSDLNGRMLPAHANVAALSKAYVDQETGQRGYLLTGDPDFLLPYQSGRSSAPGLVESLRIDLAGDQQASRDLDAVLQTADAWNSQAAQPGVAARQRGPVPAQQLESMSTNGKLLFDELRRQLSALDTRTDQLITSQLDRVRGAQRVANAAQITALALVGAVAILAAVLVSRLLTRPVNTVLRDVRAVSEGNYDHHIFPRGPREISTLAEAAERMRDNLRTSTKRLVEAERRDEQARLAADLHNRTIRRVFSLGLKLTSAAARGNRELRPLITETDNIIHDLQAIIFNLDEPGSRAASEGLRPGIIGIIDDSAPVLGFTPSLSFSGPVESISSNPDLQATILAVLREGFGVIIASGQATAASVQVTVADQKLFLQISDNAGTTSTAAVTNSIRRIRLLARQHSAEVTVREPGSPERELIKWIVRLEATPTD